MKRKAPKLSTADTVFLMNMNFIVEKKPELLLGMPEETRGRAIRKLERLATRKGSTQSPRRKNRRRK